MSGVALTMRPAARRASGFGAPPAAATAAAPRPVGANPAAAFPATADAGAAAALRRWLRSQVVNGGSGALLIRPFHREELGEGAVAPSNAHIAAVNAMMTQVRGLVAESARALAAAAAAAGTAPTPARLAEVGRLKSENNTITGQAEQVWQYYWEVFSQRQTFVAPKLLAADRIALDCYQWTWQGLGRARSIPSPAPFAYLESGIGPATYRRGIALSKLGRLPNPFPLVKLPYHRLVTPWTLGALPHEVGHNIQADLGLWFAVPRVILRRLAALGLPSGVRLTWARWHKEIWADLIAVLLIGPSYIGSLMDVVGRSRAETMHFSPRAVHPTPWLRVFINTHLLARMGFAAEARAYNRAWLALHPPAAARAIPAEMRTTFARAVRAVVDAIAFTPYPQLGGRALAQVTVFRRQDQAVAEEAARRLATGVDPGIAPERFLIAAARIAFDRRLAPPGEIARHFYDALGRR